MENIEHTDIEIELANSREMKRVRRQTHDTEYSMGARPIIKGINIEKFKSNLDSMEKTEERGLVRYSRMPMIEFGPSIADLKAQRRLIKAISRANNTAARLKARVEAAQ